MNQNIVRIHSVEQWKQEVINSDYPVIVSFYADWCNPCHKLNPLLIESADKNKGKWKLALVDVEIEELEGIVKEIANSKIPSVYFMRQGQKNDYITGFGIQKTKAFLEKASSV